MMPEHSGVQSHADVGLGVCGAGVHQRGLCGRQRYSHGHAPERGANRSAGGRRKGLGSAANTVVDHKKLILSRRPDSPCSQVFLSALWQ